MTTTVAAGDTYNASDPTQQAFLSALALGESGNVHNSIDLGTGGADLSNAPTDQYGFPQWTGNGGSHAAGTYQFQPGTWDPIASQYGLNFQSAADQNEGAWYDAAQVFARKTGGQSLEAALNAGDFGTVQSALASEWPSVNGNGAAPAGLAANLASGTGASLSGLSPTAGQGSANGATGSSSTSGGTSPTSIAGYAQRFGLIVIGGGIALVALWQLLSQTGAVPSPGQTVKAAGKAAGAVAAAA